jgi:Mg-chelatase subunit ChlD
MFSVTEERLRTFVEKLAEALTDEVKVEVRPGDSWAAYPGRQPPLLTFKLADVAVIGDEILSVTAHEIAHLLYTTPGNIKFPFDVGKYPRAAHLLLNAVEDSRIERVFSESFPGARSLFDRKSEVAYDGKVQKGFEELPAKWRFVLNIDRVLHGLEPWGSDVDVKAVELSLDHVLRGMWSDDTTDCASHLEVPFKLMIELMRREKLDEEGVQVPPHLEIPPELLGLPSDYEANAPQDDNDQRTGQTSDQTLPGATEDDHKVGGADGTQGKRQQADGGGTGEGQKGIGEGSKAGKAQDGKGTGAGNTAGDGSGGDLSGGFGDDSILEGDDPVDTLNALTQEKTTNIVEEMVQEELAKGSTNKTIDILSYRQRQRAKQAKDVEKVMDEEKKGAYKELLEVFGRDKFDAAFEKRMKDNVESYLRHRAELDQEIRTLRTYARTVLRDNAAQRFSGNHTSGRKIKTHRLYRMDQDDPRLFEKKEATGGKSYAVAVVVDQSSSMRSGDKNALAYRAALVFLEAFEGLVETSAIGFSDINYADAGGFIGVTAQDPRWRSYYSYRAQKRRPRGTAAHITDEEIYNLKMARTYKSSDSNLKLRKAMIPELARTYSSTPMEYGLTRAIDQLQKSTQQIRAIVIITDGEPNDAHASAHEFVRARNLGIETYALYIGGRRPGHGQPAAPGLAWLGQVADRVVEVRTTASIPQAVYSLLRGVVRRRRYAA